ncbi:uncharacterized protein F5891DRAFT_1169967 [Suillus fuscotomentosus]|uniref:Uncharacterized protein n=1 Tax=Suillus fuscotomentosus TaxID=1912939 RepID=A0AAD4EHU7_9AGAM|nr:uncharacterized protein F5891DRAFT_1169967 [Suillus fuscotomentosus]KAG1906346.1 hypothetical protein F5891DRAFT_1169967 [Suillus fuscotomentosus]
MTDNVVVRGWLVVYYPRNSSLSIQTDSGTDVLGFTTKSPLQRLKPSRHRISWLSIATQMSGRRDNTNILEIYFWTKTTKVSSQLVVQYDELAVLLSLENVPLSLETVLDTGTDTYHTLLTT